MGDTTSNEFEFTPRASSPLFLHLSDVPGTSLVSVPFSGTGFEGWKRSIIVSLLARNKIAFIDGTLPRPPINSPECKHWDRVNNMRELAFTCQGVVDIASYFNKLKKLWDELTVMSSNHAKNCNCAAKPGLEQEEEENMVHQFLMGLNETYVNVRSNILLMNPLPSLDNVYNILLQDENQRFNLGQYKGSLFCKYCKKNNHTIETCYRLHGFPQNFKFTKGRKYGTTANIESSASRVPDALTTSGSVSQESMIPGLKKEHCSQLLMLLQSSTLDFDSQTNLMGSANFAGNISTQPLPYCDSFVACILSSIVRVVWIVNSGATDHMISSKDFLFDIKPLLVPCLVSLPNGYKVKVTCTSSLTLSPSFVLHHVPSRKKLLELGKVHHGLYKLLPLTTSSSSPSSHSTILLKLNCICISDLAANVLSMHSSPASFLNDTTLVVNNSPLNNNVSIVSDSTISTLSCVKSDVSCMNFVNAVTSSDIVWHHRLGHIPFAKMKAILAISPNISSKQSFICPICPLARQSRLPFPCQRDKFQPRVVPCIFVSYPFGKKGYKLYNLQNKSVLISRDVNFHEVVFPFYLSDSPYSIPSPLPSSPSPIISDPSGPSAFDVSLPPSFPPSSPISTSSPISAPASPPSSFSFTPQSDSSSAHSSHSPISSSLAAPRKSTRTHNLPSHLQDYVLSLPPSFYSSTTTTTVAPTAAVEPHSYHQAAISPAWQEAMKKEFKGLEANHIWDIVDLPQGKKPIGYKCVYKMKHKADGSVDRYKARLVARGDTQVKGVDFA
ncbi:uncharacterized protein LOC142181719 [Nicotiana tabacum]|uniref:Uncharacterized protein LOC142181719 n=1 Tax=Nicotiana tabacum TaxID=4097 RepID=A0AC58UP45_TOBAC